MTLSLTFVFFRQFLLLLWYDFCFQMLCIRGSYNFGYIVKNVPILFWWSVGESAVVQEVMYCWYGHAGFGSWFNLLGEKVSVLLQF